MFEYDISFCGNQKCKYEKCIRHHTKIPVGVPVSVAAFMPRPDGKCEFRFDEDWVTVDCTISMVVDPEE